MELLHPYFRNRNVIDLYIRVDANSDIGMGHLSRCLTIAEQAKSSGFNVTFLSGSPAVAERASASDFLFEELDQSRFIEVEIPAVHKILEKGSSDKKVLLIDTYQITENYISAFADIAKIVYLGSKQIASNSINLVINYSCTAKKNFYTQHCPNSKLCLGIQYAPLREVLWIKQKSSSDRNNRVLITAGGSDTANITYSILNTLIKEPHLSSYTFETIIGPLNPNKSLLVDAFGDKKNIELRINERNMAKRMDNCAYAISASGTTLYELAAKRIPTVAFALNAEQEPDAKGFHNLGLLHYSGTLGPLSMDLLISKIKENLLYILANKEEVDRINRQQYKLLPENGTKKIVTAIKDLWKATQ